VIDGHDSGQHGGRRRGRHHDHHGHHHGTAGARAGARYAGSLRWSLVLVVAFLGVQVVVGVVSGSLALLSDAGHMATDALALGMALAAIAAADRSASGRPGVGAHRTFGLYRLEILAALANAVLLIGVAGYVLVEAVRRLGDPPAVSSWPVLLVGLLGLGVNAVAFLLLRRGAAESLNVRGAYLEVVADALGSLGVVVAALVMGVTGWGWVDPVVASGIGVFILPRAWRLGRDALRVLVQAAPSGLDVDALRGALEGLAGVADVHDLHVWTLTSDMDVLTAHLVLADGATSQEVLDAARRLVAEQFSLAHATLQVESAATHACTEITW
jgi:cobalt-zinc-cadmium efflux system protein